LPLILQQGNPLLNEEDAIGEDIDDMDKICIQVTGTPFIEEVDNDDILITDTEDSGSGRMEALTDESEDYDGFIGLWGLPLGLFNKTPPREPGLLNQTVETQPQVEPPGIEKDEIEEAPKLRRSPRLNHIQ
jgi:hypothetical protein